MAIRDDWPELAGIIDKTLVFMTPDEHAAIRNKWLSIRYEYGIDKIYVLKWVLSVAGLAFLIIAFVLIWNKRLKTEVVLRKKSEDAFAQNEYRYKSAQRMGKVGNWEYDLVTETFWGSDQAKRIYGFDPGSKHFTTDEVENCIPEKERVHQALIDLIEKDKPYNLEFDIHPVSGSKTRTIRSTAEIIKDDSGAPLKVLGVIHDITDQKRAGQEKAKLEQELMQAQKMESVGRLAGGVAHDYNNISSIIIGFSELALEKVEQDDPVHDDLMEIYNAANRSTDITRQLLAFARQQTIAPEVLDLNATIETMLKMLRRLIGEDIDLAWLPGADVWPVKIDPSQVDQIFANLCVNARDAIVDVGRVTIETRNKRFDEEYCANHAGFVPGDYVMLAVSDDGCGIAPEALDKIFEPFFTTKGLDQGTGLGLSTVYGIVKQNDGFINVYSEPEKGTTIKIYLSRHTGQAVEAHSEKTLDIPLGQGETVLLVEDDGSILKLGERILKNLGYVVLSANSPGKAIKLAEENASVINLLITDVVMPEMNGRELSEQLRTLCPDLKTLFMSGYTANVIAHRGVLEDGVNFMSKPFSKKDMAVKIREALDEAKS
ncbi:MAG: response regulator [Desulfotignum sp.]|nr:response regulator [Desulfotignum sp.]MCF8089964.1 response regulator [Desulfotignum sp.]MCF8137043.1 response regulator [Desulfotignum sp.]